MKTTSILRHTLLAFALCASMSCHSAEPQAPLAKGTEGTVGAVSSARPASDSPHVAPSAVQNTPPQGAPAQATALPTTSGYLFNDVHVHLTNYVQEGPDVRTFLAVMGKKVGRAGLFGIPLQQLWSTRVSGDFAPTYYLNSDSPLYYYSFTDAYIAQVYKSLTPEQQKRFDPMITGFNPADMYAADHIRRVLTTFPGVFVGIGEFTIHKEFVSSKVAGEIASLRDPALDRLLDFAGEAGLVALMHNDMDVPFPEGGAAPAYLEPMKAVLRRHPKTTIIWAHVGMGRVIRPVKDHGAIVSEILADPAMSHVYFDLSWSEVAKYLTSSPEAIAATTRVINRFPDRFLFGTDAVSPTDPAKYFSVYETYAPVLAALTPETRNKVLKKNYERLFDAARVKVRAWEQAKL